ncbi:hypothetical protein B0H11DRAFT_644247 [Mycena galericulata]|nr:hypothetical protein B0H11DRAFT_644247 [Mycena galericulata]
MAGVELLFGPMLIGVLLNMMLYGVVFIQMVAYFERYPNDSTWIRCLMLYLFLVATANVFIESGILYQPLIMQYGEQASFLVSPKLLPGDSILIAIVSAPIQLFTAWRISVITGSFIVPTLIGLLSLTSFAGGILVSIMVFMNPEFRNFDVFSTEVTLWLVSSAVCDVSIAIAMSYSLWKRKTGFSRVDGQINRIVRLTVETGTVTAVAALVDVLLFKLFPNTSLNFIVDYPLSNLYTCSILAMLNSRERVKPRDAEYAHTPAHTPAQTLVNHSNLQSKPFQSSRNLQVFTTTEKFEARDNGDFAPTMQPDFHKYNSETRDLVKPRTAQLELRPKIIVPLNGSPPERF